LPGRVTSVLAADPRVARVQAAAPTSLFVMGVAAGRTTIIATAEDGNPVAEYDVTVRPSPAAAFGTPPMGAAAPAAAAAAAPALDGPAIEAAIHRTLRSAADVRVQATRDAVVLTGTVPAALDAQQVVAVARSFAGEGRTVLNNLTALSSIQVNVRVRVAEISRQVTRELGFNWQALHSTGNFALGTILGQATAPVLGLSGASRQVMGALASRTVTGTQPGRFSGGYSAGGFDINAIIDALAADQLISILAEPNLTAQSGETASFLAGGEFPIPVAATETGQITIQFKPYGVSLAFVPTVLSPERLNLRVRPEVSELSEVGAISVPVSGGTVTIPALTSRRAETTVELGSGQSFAIAGLLQRSSTQVDKGVMGLSEIPVLGALFRSDRFQRNETELVIIVTPYLVRPVSDPRELTAPTDRLRLATDIDRILFNRQTARGGQRDAPRPAPLDAGFMLE
jgi:pilus assembly protein CpaC